jgi:fatty acyl-CoA reductase
MGTKNLVTLYKQMKKLDCLVFVSTAFSNCQLDEIEEKLYPLPHDPDDIINLYNTLDAESLESLVPKLIQNRPNTYVYTKALSEHIIAKEVTDTTLVIARPAIVGPAVLEPAEGWTDSLHGPAGLSILAGLGIVQTVDWDFNVKPDATPVDFLANALLSSSWHAFTHKKNQQTVYNMTSSNFKPMSAGDFMTFARNASLDYPSIYAMRPCMHPPRYRQSRIMYKIRCFFYHILFAYLIDALLTLVGRPKM